MRISIEVEITDKEERVCEYAGLPADVWADEAFCEWLGKVMEKYEDEYDAYVAEMESRVPDVKLMGRYEDVR